MALPWIYIVATLVHLGVTLRVGAKRIGVSARRWWSETLVPTVGPAIPGTLAAWGIHVWLPAGWLRIVLVIAAYTLVASPFCWWWSVGPKEKKAFAHAAERLRARLERGGIRAARGGSARG